MTPDHAAAPQTGPGATPSSGPVPAAPFPAAPFPAAPVPAAPVPAVPVPAAPVPVPTGAVPAGLALTGASYHVPRGGLPPQTTLTTERSRFTTAYAVIPARTLTDIVASRLPFWTGMRMWVLARPLSGFAETFSQYVVELSPGGGSDRPEEDPRAEAVLFVVEGEVELGLAGATHVLGPGGYAYLPPGAPWTLHHHAGDAGDQSAADSPADSPGDSPADSPGDSAGAGARGPGAGAATFHWIRKVYDAVPGLEVPGAVVTNERDVAPTPMPGTDAWSTTRFVDPDDVRHDMQVNIVTFAPGGAIPFPETHVMEHGLYVLEGKAVYLLNEDWVEVEAGDFMWLRAFCPQACYAGGPTAFRYLLYKDVHRHMRLGPVVP